MAGSVLETAGGIMSRAADFRRQMGMDMVKGDHYDPAKAESSITANGKFIVPVGETMFGFTNDWSVPVRLYLRAGIIQTYEPIYPADVVQP
jgi:hypothetical protein